MLAENEKPKCGSCNHFDLKTNGEPVGIMKVWTGGKVVEVTLGYCRVNKGLALGALGATVSCKQPDGFFKPKEPTKKE